MDTKERQEATMRLTAQYLRDLQQQDALVDKIVERVVLRLEPLIRQMITDKRSESTSHPS